MPIKRQPRPPTMVPIESGAGQRELRQCECCWKLQSIGDGFDIKRGLCKECAEAMDAPISEKLAAVDEQITAMIRRQKKLVRQSLWARFRNWLRGIFATTQ